MSDALSHVQAAHERLEGLQASMEDFSEPLDAAIRYLEDAVEALEYAPQRIMHAGVELTRVGDVWVDRVGRTYRLFETDDHQVSAEDAS